MLMMTIKKKMNHNKNSLYSAAKTPNAELRPISEESNEQDIKLSTLHEFDEFN